MTSPELCQWLRDNSAGIYRPAAEAADRIEELERALWPLAEIAVAYRKDGLDECRPSWGDGEAADSQKELFSGRGGKQLLTLEHALRAHAALSRK